MVRSAIFLTLCLAVLPSFAADCTTTKLANLNGYTDYKELVWKTPLVDVGQIFLTKHVCENGKPYLSIEVHGPYSTETYSLPLEDLEELSELRRPLEKLRSEFEIGPVYTSCRTTKTESRIDVHIDSLLMRAITCVDTGNTYLTISVPGGYRRVISVSVFNQEVSHE